MWYGRCVCLNWSYPEMSAHKECNQFINCNLEAYLSKHLKYQLTFFIFLVFCVLLTSLSMYFNQYTCGL